ncbi:MAG: hypothetical protein HY352_04780 [Candidatus Omnitrophica bacterium]|nr:hypothetical protein [Candidatus Omnitrophota bacterium]
MRIIAGVLMVLVSSIGLCPSGWADEGYCGQLKAKGLAGKQVVVYPVDEKEANLTFGRVVEVDQHLLVLDAVRMENKMYDPNLAYGNHGNNGQPDRTRAYINCKHIFSIAVIEESQEGKQEATKENR